MGHSLEPKSGLFLPLDEVVTRLKREFRIVEASQEEAQSMIDGMLEYGRWLQSRGVKEGAPVTANLRQVRDSSLMVAVADRKRYGREYLSFLLKPDQGIFVDYEDGHHEKAAKPLLERVARALQYEIAVV
jgi:hypothetical protein